MFIMSHTGRVVPFLVLMCCTNISKVLGAEPGELSKEMCTKYLKSVPESYDCPTLKKPLEVGNYFAEEGEFPHTVLLGYEEDGNLGWFCAASLISDQYVLTSAHCLIDKNRGSPVAVRLGVTTLNDTTHVQEIKVGETIVHPDFAPPSVYNDIGLIKLEKKVDINNYVRPACLFTEKEINENQAINVAWGALRFAEKQDDRLQKVVLELYNEADCNKTYAKAISSRLNKGITYDNMVCAGTKSILTYQPETGGSLQIIHKDAGKSTCFLDLVGVAAIGRPSVAPDIPHVYIRVSAYVKWIEDNVWK